MPRARLLLALLPLAASWHPTAAPSTLSGPRVTVCYEDEQLVESSAPVTKQPRTAAVEGDADEHHVGHAMAPPPTSDSTDTDVPIGQVAMTPSKHTSMVERYVSDYLLVFPRTCQETAEQLLEF